MFNSHKSNENIGFNDILYNHESYNEIFQKRLKMWMIELLGKYSMIFKEKFRKMVKILRNIQEYSTINYVHHHPKAICIEEQCSNKECEKRHPNICKNWQKGSCKFTNCQFKHQTVVNKINDDSEKKIGDININDKLPNLFTQNFFIGKLGLHYNVILINVLLCKALFQFTCF